MPPTKTRKKKTAKTKRTRKPQKKGSQLTQSFRFTVEPIGPRPDKRLLKKIIGDARNEAVREFTGSGPKRASVEPPGGLFGFGAEVVYILHLTWPYLHAAGAAVAKGAVTEAGKELFRIFADKLRKKDIRPSEPEISPPEIKAHTKSETAEK